MSSQSDPIIDLFARSRNPATVMRCLAAGVASRAEITERCGLDPASVSRTVARLVRLGMVSQLATNRLRSPGRPCTVIAANGEKYWIVGLHIGVHSASAARVGIGGTVSRRVNYSHGPSPEETIATACRAVKDLCASETSQPLGVGVAVGGWVSRESGVVHSFPELGWKQVNLGQQLEEALGIPVACDSTGRAHARANLLFGDVGHDATFVHLFVGSIVQYALCYKGEIVTTDVADSTLDSLLIKTSEPDTYKTVHEAISDEGIAARAHELGLVPAGTDFEEFFRLADGGNAPGPFTDVLTDRALATAQLVEVLQQIVPVPQFVLSASIARQARGIEDVKQALQVIPGAPQIISGGDVVKSSSLAAASVLWTGILDATAT